MNNQELINFQRLFRLLKNDLLLHIKPILIVIALLSFLSFFYAKSELIFYFMILYIAGFIITSLAFTDLHNNQRAYLTLTLPCSNLERFLNKWLLTSIGFAIGTLILCYLLSWINYGIYYLAFQQTITTIPIFQASLWLGIGKYIIFQSIILLGAITFRRFTLIKTLLAFGCFFLAIELLFVLVVWMFSYPSSSLLYFTTRGTQFIFWSILFLAAPFCWYATYLRLTEFELR